MLSYYIFDDAGDPGIHVQNSVTKMSNSPSFFFCYHSTTGNIIYWSVIRMKSCYDDGSVNRKLTV